MAVTNTIIKVNEGLPVSFSCESFGIPTPKIRWIADNNSVFLNDFVNISSNIFINDSGNEVRRSSISIVNSTKEFELNYTCIANNSVENLIGVQQNMSVVLFVQGMHDGKKYVIAMSIALYN